MLLRYGTAAQLSWPTLCRCQSFAPSSFAAESFVRLRSHIQALELYDDADETDEQALARYEKEEMNMSCLSTLRLFGRGIRWGQPSSWFTDTSRGHTQQVAAAYYACVAYSSMQDIIVL